MKITLENLNKVAKNYAERYEAWLQEGEAISDEYHKLNAIHGTMTLLGFGSAFHNIVNVNREAIQKARLEEEQRSPVTKSEYKAVLVKKLIEQGIELDANKLKSALSKCARHQRNKYGGTDWHLEYQEAGVSNGVYFYNEFNKKDTFNREVRKSMPK